VISSPPFVLDLGGGVEVLVDRQADEEGQVRRREGAARQELRVGIASARRRRRWLRDADVVDREVA
jgi:hypothetical protein